MINHLRCCLVFNVALHHGLVKHRQSAKAINVDQKRVRSELRRDGAFHAHAFVNFVIVIIANFGNFQYHFVIYSCLLFDEEDITIGSRTSDVVVVKIGKMSNRRERNMPVLNKSNLQLTQ